MNRKNFNRVVLYAGTALLMTHELDAVMNREWLVLPLTSWLSPESGYAVFLWFHLPLFFSILTLLSSGSDRVRNITATGISVFLVLHAILHWLFSGHQNYAFSSISSNLLIYGGSLFGAVYLLLKYQEEKDRG